MATRKVTYARRWNFRRHKPIDPLTPEQAKARYGTGDEYAVALWDDDETVPEAVVELVWENYYFGVWFFDKQGRRTLNYAFRPSNGKLFLFDMIQYSYPESASRNLADAYRIGHLTFNEDGTAQEVITDDQTQQKTTEDRRDVNVSSHWEPMPAFDNYESIARWNRDQTT